MEEVGQAGRFQMGGTIFPRLSAMTSMAMPVAMQSSSASTDESTQKRPPVR